MFNSRISTVLIPILLLLHQIDRSSSFSTRLPTTLQQIKRHNTNILYQYQRAKNSNAQDVVNDVEKKKALRKTILSLMFPFAVAISANAPFLYVILNPPTPDEREIMLMDFCTGDTCTLLGGGSGYGGGDIGGDAIGAEALASIPSLDEFEAMARTAAELADTVAHSIL